jgi:hypothetical protein
MTLVDVFEQGTAKQYQHGIFSLDQIQYSFGSQLLSMIVVNSILILDLNVKLLKINLDLFDAVEEIPVQPLDSTASSTSSSVPIASTRRLFLDTSGSHLILSSNGENYYLNIQSKTLKALSKFKGISITCVGWGLSNKKCTGAFLFGGSNGNIYQASIAYDGSSLDVSLALVYALGDMPIQGIYFNKFSAGRVQKTIVLVCTSNRLVEFIVNDFTEKIFSPSIDDIASIQELPGNIDWSVLAISTLRDNMIPQKWAWLTEPGVFCGEFAFLNTKNGSSSVLKDSFLLK